MKVGGDGAWHGPTRREGCLDGRNELARAAADLHALDRRVPDTLDSQGVRRSHNDHRLARARERDVCAARVGHKAEAEAAGGADGAQDDEIGLASLHRVDGEDGDVGEARALEELLDEIALGVVKGDDVDAIHREGLISDAMLNDGRHLGSLDRVEATRAILDVLAPVDHIAEGYRHRVLALLGRDGSRLDLVVVEGGRDNVVDGRVHAELLGEYIEHRAGRLWAAKLRQCAGAASARRQGAAAARGLIDEHAVGGGGGLGGEAAHERDRVALSRGVAPLGEWR
mmetsp:Transcript_51333/g.142057  ORF Transcript_51333/g.142057 Transcript_51333/m.142057 type:complete len:284 (+) Transcript_51333:382-1233(+)